MRSYGVQPGRGHRAFAGRGRGGRRRRRAVARRRRAGDLPPVAAVRPVGRRRARWRPVELPAQQVRDELAAARHHRRRGVGGRLAAVHGRRRRHRRRSATWSPAGRARDVMAREVAVDVASHSPQVDPILADLADALADLDPMTPTVPFYSATLDDPRAQPSCDAAATGWTTCASPVQFAAAVQAALDDGFRVFGELSPHPLLMRAVEQTAARRDVRGAGVAGDAARAGAAARAARTSSPTCTARAPRWISRCCTRPGGWSTRRCRRGPRPPAAHRLQRPRPPGAAVRDHCRRASAAGCARAAAGGARAPRVAGRRRHRRTAVAGRPSGQQCAPPTRAPPTARWLWPPPAPCSARPTRRSRDIQFEQLLLLDERHRGHRRRDGRGPGRRRVRRGDRSDGERVRRAVATLHAVDDAARPTAPRHRRPAQPRTRTGSRRRRRSRQWFATRGIQFGPAFTGLTAVHTADGDGSTLLAEVGCPATSARNSPATASIRRCWTPASSRWPRDLGRGRADGGLLLPLSVAPAAPARPGARRALLPGTGNLGRRRRSRGRSRRVGRSTGKVVVLVAGLRMGSRSVEGSDRERVLAERLLDRRMASASSPRNGRRRRRRCLAARQLPTTAMPLATQLAEALTTRGARLPDRRAGDVSADELTARRRLRGVVLSCRRPATNRTSRSLSRGRELVASARPHRAGIAGRRAASPRGCMSSPAAHRLLHRGDQSTSTRAGCAACCGSSVPNTRHCGRPRSTSTRTRCRTRWPRNCSADSDEDETAWRDGSWYTARLQQSPAAAG